ncbi:MAG: hypothetical protein AMJ91_06550 [candidate division Zixibacteria bacterium SM23_73_3]|nr:MAG: hypothetical protein AMJ91_06550 [candidate division Zixibacteria bacterium SM23_73_3]
MADKESKYSSLILQLLNCLFLMVTFFLLASAAVFAWEKIEFQETPTREMFPQFDAVIIKDEATMEIKSNGEALLTQHRIMKIFSDPDKRYSHQEIPFNNSVEVIKIKAHTIHSNGNRFSLDEEDIRERSLLSEYILYSDAKVKEFYFPRVDTNCVVEYEYQLLLRSLLYWGDWFFQTHLPVLSSKYTLITPKRFDFKVKVLNDKIEPKIDFHKGKKVFVWETSNKNAIRKEVFMPPASDIASRLVFSPLSFRFDDEIYSSKNWNEIARWFWEISQTKTIPSQKINLLAFRLTSGVDSKEKKIKAVFDYVQEHVRYISVAIGTGAFKPHPCADVLEYGYGDCKDMTTLLITLLKTIDIEAYPALLSTKGHRRLLTSMPKVKQFDHVVVAIPLNGEYIWLDPACRNCQFGQLPFEDQKASALVIKPDGGELTLTPETEEDENVTRTFWEIKLNSDGSVSGNLTIQATGQEELAFRASLAELKPQRRRKALTGFLSFWLVDPFLVKYEFNNFEEKDSNIFIQASFVAGGFGVEQQERLFLPVNLNTQNYLNLMFPHKQRVSSVVFDYKFINVDEVTLQIPAEFQVEHLPGAVRLDEPFGLFESIYKVEKDKIVHKRVFVRKELFIPVAEYGQLKYFYHQASGEDNKRIILKRKRSTGETNK